MAHIRKTKYGIECDQEWDDLSENECGKFCETCQKNVIDFVTWDRDAVVRHMKQNPKTCGRFRMDHVDPLYSLPRKPIVQPRMVLFGLLSAMGVSNAFPHILAEKPGTELSPPKVNLPFAENEITYHQDRTYDEAQLIPTKDTVAVKKNKVRKKTPKRFYITRRTYLTVKSPFIHRERRIMGCPDF